MTDDKTLNYRIGMLVNLNRALALKADVEGIAYCHPDRLTLIALAEASMTIAPGRSDFAAWKSARERGDRFPTEADLRDDFNPAIARQRIEELKIRLANPVAASAYQEQCPASIKRGTCRMPQGETDYVEPWEDPFEQIKR